MRRRYAFCQARGKADFEGGLYHKVHRLIPAKTSEKPGADRYKDKAGRLSLRIVTTCAPRNSRRQLAIPQMEDAPTTPPSYEMHNELALVPPLASSLAASSAASLAAKVGTSPAMDDESFEVDDALLGS